MRKTKRGRAKSKRRAREFVLMELNKIYNADCLEFMRSMPDSCVDLVVTDPPYVLDSTTPGKTSIGNTQKYKTAEYKKICSGFDIEAIFGELKRISKKFNLFCFCSNAQLSKIMAWGEANGYYTTCLVWHKYNAAPFANGVWRQDAEFCVHIREKGATFQGDAKLKCKITKIPNQASKYGHPTEKPIELIKKYVLIGSSEGDTVFDPFMGSGTTAAACKELNRNFIGCEIESKYCEMAEKRLRETVKGLF